jgi:hypothetical protein
MVKGKSHYTQTERSTDAVQKNGRIKTWLQNAEGLLGLLRRQV